MLFVLADAHDSLGLDFCKKQISSSNPQTILPQNTAYDRLLKLGVFYTPNKHEWHFLGVVCCINIMNDVCHIIFTEADLWRENPLLSWPRTPGSCGFYAWFRIGLVTGWLYFMESLQKPLFRSIFWVISRVVLMPYWSFIFHYLPSFECVFEHVAYYKCF